MTTTATAEAATKTLFFLVVIFETGFLPSFDHEGKKINLESRRKRADPLPFRRAIGGDRRGQLRRQLKTPSSPPSLHGLDNGLLLLLPSSLMFWRQSSSVIASLVPSCHHFHFRDTSICQFINVLLAKAVRQGRGRKGSSDGWTIQSRFFWPLHYHGDSVNRPLPTSSFLSAWPSMLFLRKCIRRTRRDQGD